MVSYCSDNRVVHTSFKNIAAYLEPGDVLVINTSGTLNAALPATATDGTEYELHLSTWRTAGEWVVELRRPGLAGTRPFYEARPGQVYWLPAGGRLELLQPYSPTRPTRLW